MKRALILLCFLQILWAGDPQTAPMPPLPKPSGRAHSAHALLVEEIRSWITFLSSDEMQGRKQGTPEAELAADWIGEKFKAFGLKPYPDQSSFFLSFEGNDEGGETVKGRNVLAYLEGSDPKMREEYILLSAHYDHIGSNPTLEGDKIFNGADDNASGVSIMLAVAKQLAEGKAPKRSVLFMGWGGEEAGLVGSQYFAAHSPLPIGKISVNLNLEMLGHSEKLGPKHLFMTGAEYSDLVDTLNVVLSKHGWVLNDDPYKEHQLFFRSDNVSLAMLHFDRKTRSATGIPAHSFSTAAIDSYYHQVTDEASGIDAIHMAGLSTLFTQLTKTLGNQIPMVQWKKNPEVTFSRP